MFGSAFKKKRSLLDRVQFKVGELFFPALELVFQWWENRDADVRRHFYQALQCRDSKQTAIALLNLNMVLSLKPDHFQALVHRGRFYLKEGWCQLASEDFMKSNQISPYRFAHHDLYREYHQSVNKDSKDVGSLVVNNFTDALEVLHKTADIYPVRELKSAAPIPPPPMDRSTVEQEVEESEVKPVSFKKFPFNTRREREQFKKLGPVTQQEIEATDWDQLVEDLTP
tara:strand:- start:389 stop:1069 length:681 start_codon:yes stop_codon:yes gene_type:complete